MESLESMQGCVNRLCHSLLVGAPSPVSPSPCQGEGELVERGASPLLYTFPGARIKHDLGGVMQEIADAVSEREECLNHLRS